MGAAQTRNFLKKLSKLFCFWEDNLALAKFQCPTDTPLNHNSPQLLIKRSDNKIKIKRLLLKSQQPFNLSENF